MRWFIIFFIHLYLRHVYKNFFADFWVISLLSIVKSDLNLFMELSIIFDLRYAHAGVFPSFSDNIAERAIFFGGAHFRINAYFLVLESYARLVFNGRRIRRIPLCILNGVYWLSWTLHIKLLRDCDKLLFSLNGLLGFEFILEAFGPLTRLIEALIIFKTPRWLLKALRLRFLLVDSTLQIRRHFVQIRLVAQRNHMLVLLYSHVLRKWLLNWTLSIKILLRYVDSGAISSLKVRNFFLHFKKQW